MSTATFRAQMFTYTGRTKSPAEPFAEEHGPTLTFEWDRQTGVMTSLTWVLPSQFGDPSSALETLQLWHTGAVSQAGFTFDFAAQVVGQGESNPEGAPWLRGKLAVELPERLATVAAVYEGQGLASLIAFGEVSGDLSDIPPL